MAQGVPGRLRTRIFLRFGTTRVVGRPRYAPAAFTPAEIPGTQRLSRPVCLLRGGELIKRILVFCTVMVCQWVIGSTLFERTYVGSLGSRTIRHFKKTVSCFETSLSIYPATQRRPRRVPFSATPLRRPQNSQEVRHLSFGRLK